MSVQRKRRDRTDPEGGIPGRYDTSQSIITLEQAGYTFAEKDPLGIPAKEPGSKLDAGKSPVWQGVLDYFPRALEAVANVSVIGAQKYSWKGWESVPDGETRYRNAQGRHILKESMEGPYDSDFPGQNVLHLAQNAWNALAALELYRRRTENASTVRSNA